MSCELSDEFREELKNSRLLPSSPEKFLFHYKDTPDKVFSAELAMGIKYVVNKVPADGEFYGHYTKLNVNTLVNNNEWIIVDSGSHFEEQDLSELRDRIKKLENELLRIVDAYDFSELKAELVRDGLIIDRE